MTQFLPDIEAAAARLRAGGLVAFPTETVYGLGADALREDAVRKVFALKGRPPSNPLIVHVSGDAMARTLTPAWDARAQALADAFWPGPLSIILPRSDALPDVVTAGSLNVALRAPAHPLALALIGAFGGPIVGPSANISGRVSPTRASHVRESFSDRDVLVLDGGACTGGIESTVVLLADGHCRVLRPGLISPAQIAEALGEPVDSRSVQTDGAALGSPGQLPSHYAPRAGVRLVGGPGQAHEAAHRCAGRATLLTHSGLSLPPPHTVIAMPPDAPGYARRLYAALREADAQSPDAILVEAPPQSGADALWAAIQDRLRRAAAPRE